MRRRASHVEHGTVQRRQPDLRGVPSDMVLKLVEDFEKASYAADDEAALRAARALVDVMKRSPLIVHLSPFHPYGIENPHLAKALVHIVCLGQHIGPVRKFRLSVEESKDGKKCEVSVTIPDLRDRADSEEEWLVRKVMEADSRLAQRTDRQAELLTGVGVTVERERIDGVSE